MKRRLTVLLAVVVVVFVASTIVCWQKNRSIRMTRPTSTANQQFVTVERDVELEVLDFGGTGRPVVLLAGLGDTAHVFAAFATKLTTNYHVLGITRRGFGLSSAPKSGYDAERLGADVIAVIDALHLDRPVLAGHSVAGEELSSVATFHPEKIAGLIYLDAGNAYALWDEVYGNRGMRFAALASYIEPLLPAAVESPKVAIIAGQRRFTQLHVPILAIFADPHDLSANFKDSSQLRKEEALDFERTERQISAFQRQVPSARIVRLPHASHAIFRSNEAEVLREMNSFISSLR